jgi:DNA repair exonuclease SbcCD ATPase subunit
MTLEAMQKWAVGTTHALQSSNFTVEKHTAELEKLGNHKRLLEVVSTVVADAAQKAQIDFGTVVSGLVTECLDSVYPNNPYQFKLEFRESGGKTVVDALLYRGEQSLDPLSSTGGGVWDVLAFGLRVSLMLLTADDNTRRLLVLDEPFKFLHGKRKIELAYGTLEEVAKRFNLTMVCVRQHDEHK